jgi:hypothetical protein
LRDLDKALSDPVGRTVAVVAAATAPGSPEYQRTVAAMEDWPPATWFAFDKARLDTNRWNSPDRTAATAIEDARASTLALVCTSTHPDGFVRERATRRLRELTEPVATAALAVRAVDHVSQITDAARSALDARRSAADVAIIAPILRYAGGRIRGADVFRWYLAGVNPETQRVLLTSENRETRRYAISHAPASVDELVHLAHHDDDVHVRTSAGRRALLDDPLIAHELLSSPSAGVRALATSLAAPSAVDARLDRLLLDRSAPVRRAAQRRARELGVDAAELYRARTSRRTGVLGLGETGGSEDTQRIAPLLEPAHPVSLRTAAVVAVSWLAKPELAVSAVAPLVDDCEPGVARRAVRQLRRLGYSPDPAELDRLLASDRVWTREAGLGLALSRRGWVAAVAATALLNDVDESLRGSARAALRGWLVQRAPSAGIPSAADRARLDSLTSTMPMPDDVRRHLRFHAGLAPIDAS